MFSKQQRLINIRIFSLSVSRKFSRDQTVAHLTDHWVLFKNGSRIVRPVLFHGIDLIHSGPKNKDIFFAYLLKNFHISSVHSSKSQRTVHHKLHVSGS